MENSIAVKFDQGKPRWDLLPFEQVEKVVKILSFGAEKYGENNWKQSDLRERCFAALLRHLVAWRNGEKLDPESNQEHLSHAMCNVLFLLWYEENF